MQRFGDPTAFAVEVGQRMSPGIRAVDLWVAGKRLTTDDNAAYVPSLRHYMRAAAARVREREVLPCPFPGRSPEEVFRLLEADETEFREQYWFMRWGEIVDNISIYAYLDDYLVIVFAFWRAKHPFPEDLGKVFVAKISPAEFVATVQEAANLLNAEPAT